MAAFWNRGAHDGKASVASQEEMKKKRENDTGSNPAPGVRSQPSATQPVQRKEKSTEELLESRYGKLHSALGSGTVIQGKLTFEVPVRIDGKLSGEVYSSEAIIVGENGEIEAEVKAKSLAVLGRVKGSVKASDRVEVFAGGVLEGEVETRSFAVAEGGVFNGACKMASAGGR